MIAGMVDHGPGVSDRSIDIVKKSLMNTKKVLFLERRGCMRG
jgi:hypothetical protein